MGDLEALAETFSVNTERPGEPINPPILVRDGARYRIVDGERRFRAMLEVGTLLASFTALVADSLDDANSLLAMLATDDKQQLTDLEKSKGVQQMLTLGVKPDVVAKAAHITSAQAQYVKGALGMKEKPEKWETLDLDEISRHYSDPIVIEDMAFAIELSGLNRDDKAGGYPKWEYVKGQLETVEDFQEAVKKLPKDKSGYVARLDNGDPSYRWNKPEISIYKQIAKKDGKPVKTKEEVLAKKLERKHKENRKVRAQWCANHIATWEKDLKHTGAYVLKHLAYDIRRGMDRFDEKYGCKTPITLNAVMIATAWGCESWDSYIDYGRVVAHKAVGADCKDHIDLMAALSKDGYEINPDEQELLDLMAVCLKKGEKKSKKGSGKEESK
jgi:hypothetical protein